MTIRPVWPLVLVLVFAPLSGCANNGTAETTRTSKPSQEAPQAELRNASELVGEWADSSGIVRVYGDDGRYEKRSSSGAALEAGEWYVKELGDGVLELSLIKTHEPQVVLDGDIIGEAAVSDALEKLFPSEFVKVSEGSYQLKGKAVAVMKAMDETQSSHEPQKFLDSSGAPHEFTHPLTAVKAPAAEPTRVCDILITDGGDTRLIFLAEGTASAEAKPDAVEHRVK